MSLPSLPATLTATNADNKTATASVDVLDSLEEVTITYDSKGGSTCAPKTIYKGQEIGQMCTPTKKGYVFDGWYSEGDTKVTDRFAISNNITIYAKWKVAENPNTGIFTPIVGMIILTAASVLTFVILTKKSKMLN